MQNILEVRDLGRSYVNFRLEHISFSISGGKNHRTDWKKRSRKKHYHSGHSGADPAGVRRGAVLRRTAEHRQRCHEGADWRGV